MMVNINDTPLKSLISITGTTVDGVKYAGIKAVVADKSNETLKVWPVDFQGKLLFSLEDIESIESIEE